MRPREPGGLYVPNNIFMTPTNQKKKKKINKFFMTPALLPILNPKYPTNIS